MVQLSQIVNIRHLEIWFIQTILISTVFLKNDSMQTDMDIQTYMIMYSLRRYRQSFSQG